MTPAGLFNVLFFLSCAATSISASVLINSNRIDCSDDRVILHPHPTDCTLYLQCEHGRLIERQCAPGTEFSPSLRLCVHLWQSDCQAKEPITTLDPITETTETDGTTTGEEDVTPATEEASGNYYSPDDDSDGHIDVRVSWNFCAPDRFFLMASVENCFTYVICNYGEAIVRQCPPGEFFDSWSKTCSQNHRSC